MKKIYIKSGSCISSCINNDAEIIVPSTENIEYLKAIEPDYKNIINPALIRRMSKVVKMGVYAGIDALKQASTEQPDAIITGTSFGCLEDTESFLVSIIKNNEQFLSPTPFIQSTHNTIGAQIALLLKCNNYNMTYVNRMFSFEDALLDTLMLINEGEAKQVLVGGIDEITESSYKILKRLGLFKQDIAGEGSAFFVVDDDKSNAVEISGIKAIHDNNANLNRLVSDFLAESGLLLSDISILLSGANDNNSTNSSYNKMNEMLNNALVINYKKLSGEYFTSSSFAMWMAFNIIKHKTIPTCLSNDITKNLEFKNVLVYNNYFDNYHSLILLKNAQI